MELVALRMAASTLVALGLAACTASGPHPSTGSGADPREAGVPAGRTATGAATGADMAGARGQGGSGNMAGPDGATLGSGSPDRWSGAVGSSMEGETATNAVVTGIEVIMGPGQATAGTAGAAMGGDQSIDGAGTTERVFRVRLLMDDGGTQIVSQEQVPAFRAGDRVHTSNGIISQ